MFSDAGFLLNNFHIRHNNKDDGNHRQEYTAGLSDEHLEVWYDKTYITLLMVIHASERDDISQSIKDIKISHKWK